MIEPDSTLYNLLKWLAWATAAFVVGATVYQGMFAGEEPGSLNNRRGNLRLEDGQYAEALAEFNRQLEAEPGDPAGLLGRALALDGLGRREEALQALNLTVDVRPDFAVAYANRGILLDRMGRHREALENYRRALELNPELAEGAGVLYRFLRNQIFEDKPPTIADRARYLEREFQKPPGERVLRLPEVDRQQPGYKVEGEL